MPPHVFIAASSKDYELAQKVYDFLSKRGIEVFFSRESLPAQGSSDYRKEIDAALDQTMHMVVVTSSADNVRSTWVEAEWGFFVNEKRSGHKQGNLITLVAGSMTPRDLPPSLRYYEVIPFEGIERMLHYVGGARRPAVAPAPVAIAAPQAILSGRDERQGETRPRVKVAELHLPYEPLLGFVEVPGGPFLMGSDETGDKVARGHALPQHTVNLPTFYLARCPVTLAQFRVFAEASGISAHNKCGPNHPVIDVSWREALAYCRWLETMMREMRLKTLLGGGYHLSLPSEAEWEKAARGTDGRIYPWGDTINPSRANYANGGSKTTNPVGAHATGASPYGILDMSGNVWEWTRSIYKLYPYVADDGRERLEGDDLRVLRGGSFLSDEDSVRAAHRSRNLPFFRSDNLGFRVAFSRLRS